MNRKRLQLSLTHDYMRTSIIRLLPALYNVQLWNRHETHCATHAGSFSYTAMTMMSERLVAVVWRRQRCLFLSKTCVAGYYYCKLTKTFTVETSDKFASSNNCTVSFKNSLPYQWQLHTSVYSTRVKQHQQAAFLCVSTPQLSIRIQIIHYPFLAHA